MEQKGRAQAAEGNQEIRDRSRDSFGTPGTPNAACTADHVTDGESGHDGLRDCG